MMRIFALCAICVVCSASAQPIPWKGTPFFISGKNVALSGVLRDLGANYNLPVVVSSRVNEQFNGILQDIPHGMVLSELSRLYQLLPYYDGATLYIYKAQEIGHALLTPAYMSAVELNKLMASSGLADKAACIISTVGSSHALQIIGVPVCIERATALVKQLDEQNLNQEQNRETIAVYPLKYANAADVKYSYRSQDVVIPGLVSNLREMVQGRGLPLPDNKTPKNESSDTLPAFSADTRKNAILVRDRKKNLPIYAELIERLDTRPTLIEISVAIIDVDASDLNQLGIDWSVAANLAGGSVQYSSDGNLESGSFSSLVSNASSFMVRLNALTQQSKAKIISHPSVVTLDNIQAVLDRNITFYTKVSSKDSAELQSITTGALMRVTPRLIKEGDSEKILLSLNIQDGRQGPASNLAEQLPQILNAEITTQASLNLGQALLLGGFVQDENIQGERKIPFLGDIPVFGKIFSNTSQSTRSVIRLFLIKAEPHSTF